MGHLQSKGFRVKVVETTYPQLDAIKDRLGVPRQLRGCHTGVVKNYVIEGHVPGRIIARLLREKPDVAGLAVPGMPPGSPGMGGRSAGGLSVYSFDRQGRVQVYERINP